MRKAIYWLNRASVRLGSYAAALAALAVLPGPTGAALKDPIWQESGVAYFCDTVPRLPLVVHVVRIDRSQKDLELHTTLGGNDQIGMAVLSDQVSFINSRMGQPMAAVNGDYYYVERPFAGDPMNLQILRGGELVSAPMPDRAFFYLDAAGQPHITNAVDSFAVIWPNRKATPIGLNQAPDTGQTVLYTSAVGSSTRVQGVDLVLERNDKDPWLPLRVGETLNARVRRVNRQGYSQITPDTMVLSLSPRALNQLPPLTNGMVLKISTKTVPDLSGATMAIGGGPTLVRGGKARDAHEFQGFQMREPRTAMGWNEKYFYFVQADGRQPRYSMGMSLEELAGYFVKLGCDHAINLDGGGSCTTWVGGKIVNSPAQRGRERPSANALVVVRKPKTGSQVSNN